MALGELVWEDGDATQLSNAGLNSLKAGAQEFVVSVLPVPCIVLDMQKGLSRKFTFFCCLEIIFRLLEKLNYGIENTCIPFTQIHLLTFCPICMLVHT